MKSTITKVLCMGWVVLCMDSYAQSTCTSLCANPGFESGEAGWTFLNGTACQGPTSEPCDLVNDSIAPFQHFMQTVGQTAGDFDPVVGGNILQVVPPGGGNNTMRLGDGANNGAKASRISITYSVTPTTANFTYKYAAVLQEPQSAGAPHTDAQRPYFSINVYDENGNSIPCGNLFVLAKEPFDNFKETSNGSNIWYREWTTEVIALSAFIGQCVKIEFTAADCALNEHFGYAYLDADCSPADIIITSSNNCGGYTLTGPENPLGYEWTNITVGGTTGIVGSNTERSVDVNLAGTYQLVLTSSFGPICATVLSIEVDTIFTNPVNFIPLTGCSSKATQFTDTSTPDSTITAWEWDFNNDGITDNTEQNPFYEFPNDGIFPVTLTITVGTCTESTSQNVSVSIPDIPTIQPEGPFCSNASPINLSVDDVGGTWSGSGVSNTETGVFDPALANVGNNTVTYATGAACPGLDSIVIVINLPISNPGPDITICSGNGSTIGSPSNPGETYSWSPTTGLSSPTAANPTVNLTNNGLTSDAITYYLTSTMQATGCVSTDSVTLTVNSNPLVNAGPDRTICSGGTAALSGTVSGATASYTWSGGDGDFTPNNITLTSTYLPTAEETATGTITLTLITNDPPGPCSSASDDMSIYINDSPSVLAGPNQTICFGENVTLAGSLSGTTNQGVWSGGAGTFTPDNNDPIAIYTPSSAEEAIGYITLTFASFNGGGQCGSVSSQTTIYINALPTAYAGTDKEFCNQNNVQLSGAISGPTGITATWTGGAGIYTPDNKTANANYAPTAAEISSGTISLTLTTDPIGVCPAATDQVNIAINPEATVNAGPDQTICVDLTNANTVNLSGVYGGAASSGIWSGGAGAFTPINTNPNATYTLDASEFSKANVILTYSSNDPVGACPSVNDQVMIILNQRPTANAGPEQSICLGSTARLSGVVGGAVASIAWSGGAGTYNPNKQSVNSIYTPTTQEKTAGSVLFTLTTVSASTYCPSISDQMELFITSPPTVDAGIDQSICNGDPLQLSATIGGVASSGTWSGGAGTFTPNNTSLTANYTPTNAEIISGNITLTYTSDDPTGPCTATSDQMAIHVDRQLVVDAGVTQPICEGASVQLGGSITGGGNAGIWSGGTGTFVPNNTTLNAVYTPSADEFAAASSTLTLSSTTAVGNCLAATDQTSLSFYLPPTVDFTIDDPAGCSVHCVAFTDATFSPEGAALASYTWDFGDGGKSSQTNPSHCYSQPGNFSATLKAIDENGCSTSLTKDTIVTVYGTPDAWFSTSPKRVSAHNPEVTFQDKSSPDVNYWFWDFGDGTTESPDETNPVHLYENDGNSFKPTLIVRNKNNCYDTIQLDDPIRLTPVFSFYMPNAFSPHNPNSPKNNGVNDYFYGVGTGIVNYNLWIYDRWGNEIFSTNDINEKWDGKANGGKAMAQRDVYVWKVLLSDVAGNIHNFKGIVTLVR